ncbi:aegerolysin family protein, partial [Moniliophthora roreri]
TLGIWDKELRTEFCNYSCEAEAFDIPVAVEVVVRRKDVKVVRMNNKATLYSLTTRALFNIPLQTDHLGMIVPRGPPYKFAPRSLIIHLKLELLTVHVGLTSPRTVSVEMTNDLVVVIDIAKSFLKGRFLFHIPTFLAFYAVFSIPVS